MDPRRYPNPDVIEEWSRRRERYRLLTRPWRVAFYVFLAVAVATVFLGTGEMRWFGVWLFFGLLISFLVLLQVFTFQILRCPSCELVPQLRGAAFYVSVCGRCYNYLTTEGLPNHPIHTDASAPGAGSSRG